MNDRLEISSNVVFRDLDGEAIILNLETSTYIGLDPVGTRIWALLKEHGALRRVSEVMLQEYDVDPNRLQADLLELTGRMCDLGLTRVLAREDQ